MSGEAEWAKEEDAGKGRTREGLQQPSAGPRHEDKNEKATRETTHLVHKHSLRQEKVAFWSEELPQLAPQYPLPLT